MNIPNEINQVLTSDECALEYFLLMHKNKSNSFIAHIKRNTRTIHTNDELRSWTLRHRGKVISIKTLIDDDERVDNFNLYIKCLNGTKGLPEITHYMRVKEFGDYLIIEYNFIEGVVLEEKMTESSSKTENLTTLAGVCDIVQVMHSKEIGHFDIKPLNIITNGETFLIYIDTIGRINAVPRITYGSTGYTASEILIEQDRSEKTDAFSLGAIAYEIITGRRIDVIMGVTDKELLYAKGIIDKKVPTLSEIAQCSVSLSKIVMCTLAPIKEDRPTIEEIKKCFLEESLS